MTKYEVSAKYLLSLIIMTARNDVITQWAKSPKKKTA